MMPAPLNLNGNACFDTLGKYKTPTTQLQLSRTGSADEAWVGSTMHARVGATRLLVVVLIERFEFDAELLQDRSLREPEGDKRPFEGNA